MSAADRAGRPDDEDIDAQFEAIVRNLRAEEPPSTDRPQRQRWPGTGRPPADPPNPPPPGFGRPGQPAEPPRPVDPPRPADPATDEPDEPAAPASWREWTDPEEEEHFIPPDPPPLPAGDLHFWGIVAGLLGGPLILLLAHGFQWLQGSVWTWLGLLLSLGGFVLLVLRAPTDRHDDPSGGAQV